MYSGNFSMREIIQFRRMRGRTLCFSLLFTLLAAASAGYAQDAAKTEAELRQLRSQIERIRSQVAKDAAEKDRLAKSLRSAEQSASAARVVLGRLRGERQTREQRLQELGEQKRARETELASERASLAAQMRAAHQIGREDPLKMLLNQQDPAQAGRLVSYYAYFGRARAEQLAAIETKVTEIAALERDLETEKERIARLEREQSGEVAKLDKARQERGAVLAQLNAEAKERAATLQRLQREQAALQKLLQQLRRTTPSFPSDNKSPFARMRGKLAWPVSGKIVSRFGQQRAGSMKWEGVLIGAERGAPVRAVYRGRVVYADWLAGLGLLVIVDHGGGFLSLYGHNEQLYRQVGDTVVAGDTIAAVGDTGGRPAPQLYFEIRQAARPVDPAPWFSARQP
jgi:septal ring factor EnvC (AmiA/AmiB activator)